jgi:nicotinate-nucleotide adenylyltransferase
MTERIGVFGGTFDPIHVGHLLLASELHFALQLDRVLFVPAARPPHKRDQELSPDADRLAMVRATVAEDIRFELSLIELDRDGPSYTADTIELLQQVHPRASLFFLMGEDSLRDLPTWRNPDRILAVAELGVAARPGVDVDLSDLFGILPSATGRVHLVPTPEISISSSDIRRRVEERRPIRYHVTPEVEAYIRANGLYARIDD